MADLCKPGLLNPHWDDSRKQVHLAASVAVDLFWSEVQGVGELVDVPRELEPILPDLVLAARTCAAAWTKRGMARINRKVTN